MHIYRYSYYLKEMTVLRQLPQDSADSNLYFSVQETLTAQHFYPAALH